MRGDAPDDVQSGSVKKTNSEASVAGRVSGGTCRPVPVQLEAVSKEGERPEGFYTDAYEEAFRAGERFRILLEATEAFSRSVRVQLREIQWATERMAIKEAKAKILSLRQQVDEFGWELEEV